ncbi:MAG: hypothetical protein JRF64_07030 [Deltaproteobacteria bacterium]|nr:hypothetical protein [Deltaproteobacteria bacterium]
MFPRLVLLSRTNDLTSCLCKLGAIAFEDKKRYITSPPTADLTLTLQKSRMLQIQGAKGEAIVSYCEPLATRQRRASAGRQIPPTGEMRYHPAKGGKGKQLGRFFNFLDITANEFHKIAQKDHKERLLLLLRTFCHVVYATTGLIDPATLTFDQGFWNP